jgi:anti-anti-sigma factor
MPTAAGGPPGPQQSFRVEVRPERDVVRVAPIGELDVATTPALEHQLHELRHSGFERVVLDMRGLTFVDSTGLRAILSASRFADSDGRSFSLVLGPPATTRALEISGLLAQLHVEPA